MKTTPAAIVTSAVALLASAPILATPAPVDAAGASSAERRGSRLERLRARAEELKRQLASPTGTLAPVRTADVEAAARDASPEAAAPETLDRLTRLARRRDSAGLYEEFEKHLTGGIEGFAVLRDFCRDLDERDYSTAALLTTNHQTKFGLMQLVMLHEEEAARFAHYYLVATASTPKAHTRLRLYDFLPVFLKFHRGRFDELDAALRRDMLEQLGAPPGNHDLTTLFGAMKALEFYPDMSLTWPLLENASSVLEVNLLLDHFKARDDALAARAVYRFVRMQPGYDSWKSAVALNALAAMTSSEARKYMEDLLIGRDRRSMEAANHAYFSTPRLPSETLGYALTYLNSPAPSEEGKKRFLGLVKQRSPAIFDALVEKLEWLEFTSLRTILEKERERRQASTSGAKDGETH